MKRWIWNIICGLSLLLCVATLALWVRSEFTPDALRFQNESEAYSCTSSDGLLVFAKVVTWERYGASEPLLPIKSRANDGWSFFHADFKYAANLKMGFGYGHWQRVSGGFIEPIDVEHCAYLATPFWALALMTVLGTTPWLCRFCRRQLPPGVCRTCRYDLRASKERCPECGTAIAARDQRHISNRVCA